MGDNEYDDPDDCVLNCIRGKFNLGTHYLS